MNECIRCYVCCGILSAAAWGGDAYQQYAGATAWVRSELPFQGKHVTSQWQIPVREGRCQIVGDASTIFVYSGTSRKGSAGEVLVSDQLTSRDAVTGDVLWEHQEASAFRGNQQTFGGAPATPQATPLLSEDTLVCLGFTGVAIGLERQTGTVRWRRDLVAELKAEPVQFGFAASPQIDPRHRDRCVVWAAGGDGGLLCLEIRTGKTIWRCPEMTFSYATPVWAELGGVPQWIVVSQDVVLGVDAANGGRLWEFDLATEGLTNVPTPLVVDASRFVVSGQGVRGVQCLEVKRAAKEWLVDEVWFSEEVQFFFTNWCRWDARTIVGCEGQFLHVLALEDGRRIGKFRGFPDGNVWKCGDQLLVTTGEGELHILNRIPNGLEQVYRYSLLSGRCWAAPSWIGGSLYLRDASTLCRIGFGAGGDSPLATTLRKPKILAFTGTAQNASKDEPADVEAQAMVKIVAAFETQGPDAAFQVYQRLRSQRPCPLDAEVRLQLARQAHEEGLIEMADLILQHAESDLPNDRDAFDRLRRRWQKTSGASP